jgi:hypothetical protein
MSAQASKLLCLQVGGEQRNLVFSAEKTGELVPSLKFLTRNFKARATNVLMVQLGGH